MSQLSTLRVLISYSWDSPAHRNKVLKLADRLRADGIEGLIDQYVEGTPPEGWYLWMQRRIEEADFVLMVCTETYRRRVEQQENPGVGLGVTWEAKIIYALLGNQSPPTKFIPVLFAGGDKNHIPTPLKSHSSYVADTEEGYQALYRHLRGQPEARMPPLGEVEPQPAKPRQYDRFARWTVPFPRNEFFTGREEELTQLRQMLTGEGAAALSQTAAIHGLGGVGKTQTAVEYAWRYRDDYESVFWVPAEDDTTIRKALCEIAQRLDLPQKDFQEQDLIISAVLRWLEANPGWLLIFDNADTPELVVPYRLANAAGHILVTSRESVFDCLGIRQTFPLDKLPTKEAEEFLLKRANRTHLLKPDLNAQGQAERESAVELVRELDCLALAIEQAGAYLSAHRATFISDYVMQYRRRGLDVLDRTSPQIGYHKPVGRTWSLNFEQVERDWPAAADLLRFFAFLHPDKIPWELITAGAVELGEHLALALGVDNALAFGELLRALTRYSLIELDEDERTCTIHRVVQEVLKLQLQRDGRRRAWQLRTVRAVNAAFPYVEFKNWPMCERLLPDARAAIRIIFDENVELSQAARLLSQTGWYVSERGRYAEAEPFYTRALEINRALSGAAHPDVAASLNNLAWLYRQQGQYTTAESLHREALEMNQGLFGAEHPEVAASLNNLALVYNHQQRYAEAEPLFRQALELRERLFGAAHPDVAASLNNLASVYRKRGRLAEAEHLYHRALRMREKVLGPEHPRVAATLHEIAILYCQQARYGEAEPVYHRVLELSERHIGVEHPHFASTLRNLAMLYAGEGRYAEAEPLYRRALEIQDRVLAAQHPSLVRTLENYAALLRQLGRPQEAEELADRVAANSTAAPSVP